MAGAENVLGGDPLDAELLRDLRKLGRAPTFDGADSDFQEFRFSFRIYMALVNEHALTLLDAAEQRRTNDPLTLASIRETERRDGLPYRSCSIQLYFALAMLCTGSAKTLVRTVEEGNGAEVWRQLYQRYMPETQNRLYALMQKIMSPGSWDAGGLELGLRSWELDITEWERVSGTVLNDAVKFTVLMNQAPKALKTTLQLGNYENSSSLKAALLQWVYATRDHASTLPSRSASGPHPHQGDQSAAMEVDAIQSKGKGGKNKNKGKGKGNAAPDDVCLRCGGRGHWARDCTAPDQKGKGKGKSKDGKGKKGKGKSAGWQATPQSGGGWPQQQQWNNVNNVTGQDPTVAQAEAISQRVLLALRNDAAASTAPSAASVGAVYRWDALEEPSGASDSQNWIFHLSCDGCDDPEYVLLDSGADAHVCPLDYGNHLAQRLHGRDPGFKTAAGAPLPTNGKLRVRYTMEDGDCAEVTYHSCGVIRPILSLGELTRKGYWSDLRAQEGRLYAPSGRSIPLHKKGNLYYLKMRMIAPVLEEMEAGRVAAPVRPVAIEDVDDATQARPATLKDPGSPEPGVIELHELTHFPSQPWCRFCVAARGHDAAHHENPKIDALVPEIQVDFGYMGDDGPLAPDCLLVAVDMSTGMLYATIIPSREGKKVKDTDLDDNYVASSLSAWLRELGYTKFQLHSDKEPVLRLLLDNVAKMCVPKGQNWQVMRRSAPTASHQSSGGAEKAIQTIRGLARTYILHMENRHKGLRIVPGDSINPWLVRHAAWVISRFHQRRDTRMTAYEKLKSQKYRREVLPIGENVLARRPGANVNKLLAPWVTGLWLGRDAMTDEHLIGTEGGIMRARAVRRMVPDQRWPRSAFDAMLFTPWAPSLNMPGRPRLQRQESEPIVVGPLPTGLRAGAARASEGASTSPAAKSTASASTPAAPEAAEAEAEASRSPPETEAQGATKRARTSAEAADPSSTPSGSRDRVAEALSGPSSSRTQAERRKATGDPGPALPVAKRRTQTPPGHRKADMPAIGVPPAKTPRLELPAAGPPPPPAAGPALDPAAVPGDDPTITAVLEMAAEDEQTAWSDMSWEDDIPDESDEKKKRLARTTELQNVEGFSVVQPFLRALCDSRPLRSGWVDKTRSDGSCRSRIVARGYEQKIEGDLDFYAGTPRPTTLRMLLTLAAAKGLSVAIGDCKNAFYQSDMPKNSPAVFVEPVPEAGLPPHLVWKCLKAFQGLKVSPQAWGEHCDKKFEELGMHPTKGDPCLYVNKDATLYLLRHMDDLIIIGEDGKVRRLIEKLQKTVLLSCVSHLTRPGDEVIFLGLVILKTQSGFAVSVTSGLLDSLYKLFGLQGAKAVATTGRRPTMVEQATSSPLTPLSHSRFRKAVGKLLFISWLRPDIQFAVNLLARSVASPTDVDERMCKHLIRYLLGTKGAQMLLEPSTTLSGNKILVQAFADSDWATDTVDRKSVSGYVIQLMGVTVATASKKQNIVALSSAEAELYAITICASEALGIAELLRELHFIVDVRIGTDSDAARAITGRSGAGALKHVELRRLCVQDWVKTERLSIHRQDGHSNVADLLTKFLAEARTRMLAQRIGMRFSD
jgi:hypothetical protein